MAESGGIRVTGLREVIRDLQRLGVEVGDLKTAMASIAARGASLAESFAPRRSGALAGSTRGNKAKNKAVVTAGRGKSNEYASVINYGSPHKGIAASLFMQRADKAVAPMILPALSADLNRLIAARGMK